MTMKLFCAKCSFGEESDKTEFTMSEGNLVCRECFMEANKESF